jgi:hypothetical protein
LKTKKLYPEHSIAKLSRFFKTARKKTLAFATKNCDNPSDTN